jgi:hypothetical protein
MNIKNQFHIADVIRHSFFVISTLSILVLATNPVWAQTTSSTATTQTTTSIGNEDDVNTSTVTSTPISTVAIANATGQVIKIEGQRLTFKPDNSNDVKEVIIPTNAQVKLNSRPAVLNDITVDDRVTITYSASGDVLIVDAVDNNTQTFLSILPIAAVVGVILLLVIWRVMAARNQGFIKTAPTNLQ